MAELITQRANQLAGLAVFADCFGADLYGLATVLEPVHVDAGQVLIRQGDAADFFLIIAEGSVQICHDNEGGHHSTVSDVGGQIIGEIALLRNSPRFATLIAATDLTGWRGDRDAFADLIELPGVQQLLVRTARQRAAAFITPIPVRMRDGTELLLRPVLPGDSARTIQSDVEFSAETFYRRFMTARAPSSALMDYLFQVDYVDHFVWVLTDAEDNVVADARFVRDEADSKTAEIAFMVGDDYQGRGLGSFLMKAVAIAAEVGGVEKFTARVLSGNFAMRKVFDKYGATWEREDLDVVTTEFDVPERGDVRLPRDLVNQIAGAARRAARVVG